MKKALLLFLLVACNTATPTATKLAPPPDDKIYFGAFPDFDGSEDNVTRRKIRDFEAIAGTPTFILAQSVIGTKSGKTRTRVTPPCAWTPLPKPRQPSASG
jgi:hypothetical protein